MGLEGCFFSVFFDKFYIWKGQFSKILTIITHVLIFVYTCLQTRRGKTISSVYPSVCNTDLHIILFVCLSHACPSHIIIKVTIYTRTWAIIFLLLPCLNVLRLSSVFLSSFSPFSLFFNLFGTKQSINCGVVPQFRQLGFASSPLCSLPGSLTGNLFVRVATHLWAVDTISTAKEGTHLLTVCPLFTCVAVQPLDTHLAPVLSS